MSDEEKKEVPTYEDLVSKVYDQEKVLLEKDGIIGQYQATIDDLNAAVAQRDERINKLQAIIADNLPVGRGEPKGTEVKIKTSFADSYHDMLNRQRQLKGED